MCESAHLQGIIELFSLKKWDTLAISVSKVRIHYKVRLLDATVQWTLPNVLLPRK